MPGRSGRREWQPMDDNCGRLVTGNLTARAVETATRSEIYARRAFGRPLLLQHHLPVSVLKTLEAGQEGEAEQVLRQRLVRQHHGIDVADNEAADVEHGDAGAGSFDGAVGG